MTIAAAVLELVIPGFVTAMASLFGDGIFTVAVKGPTPPCVSP